MAYAPMADGFYVVPTFGAGVTPQLHFVDLTGGHDRADLGLTGLLAAEPAQRARPIASASCSPRCRPWAR